jgi:TPR repeat protein
MARYDMQNADFSDMASSGNAEVLFELGLMYATGRNGEVDIVAAHKWLNIAAFRGLEIAKSRREELAAEMTRDEIAQAQRDARDWITTH